MPAPGFAAGWRKNFRISPEEQDKSQKICALIIKLQCFTGVTLLPADAESSLMRGHETASGVPAGHFGSFAFADGSHEKRA